MTPISFDIPTSTASYVMAQVSSVISAPGVLAVLVVVIGIPLAFYLAKKIKGLFPSR